jgi:hypothetical protein
VEAVGQVGRMASVRVSGSTDRDERAISRPPVE